MWEGRNPYLRGISHKFLMDLDPGTCLSLSLSLGRDVTAPILQVLSDSGDLGESVPLSLAPLVVSISFWS